VRCRALLFRDFLLLSRRILYVKIEDQALAQEVEKTEDMMSLGAAHGGITLKGKSWQGGHIPANFMDWRM
jgi:hypothetical protein